jgi:hypothetical protein
MSENGPREGTRDLPRAGPEAGRRAVTSDSAAGAAYESMARRARRRHQEIVELVRSGLPYDQVAARYSRDHPLDLDVTPEEVAAAVAAEAAHPRSVTAPPARPR